MPQRRRAIIPLLLLLALHCLAPRRLAPLRLVGAADGHAPDTVSTRPAAPVTILRDGVIGAGAEADTAGVLQLRVHDIDVGTLVPGACLRDSFTIENIGTTPLDLDGVYPIDNDRGWVTILGGGGATQLPKRRFIQLVFTFCAVDTGCATVRLVVVAGRQRDTVTVRGCAGKPGTLLGIDTLDFGTVAAGAPTAGAYTLRAAPGARLIGIQRIEGDRFEIPTTIPSGGMPLPTGSTDLRVVFTPVVTGRTTARFRIVLDGGWRELVAIGIGGVDSIEVDPAVLEFGRVRPGARRDLPVELHNAGLLPVSIRELRFGHPAFALAPGEPSSFTLAPDERRSLRVRLSVDSAAVDGTELLDIAALRFGDGDGSATIVLHARLAAPVDHLLWLDTATASVGDIVTLRLHCAPPLLEEDDVREIALRLPLSPSSLDPLDVVAEPGSGATVALDRGEDSSVTITITAGSGAIMGERLGGLRLRGLSTAPPETVLMPELLRPILSDVDVVCRPGALLLTGCGIGAGFGMTRRVQVRSISAGPGAIVIAYTAPAGIAGITDIVDLRGRVVLRRTLPAGDGSERIELLPTAELMPGFYLVRVIVADDAAVIPVVMP